MRLPADWMGRCPNVPTRRGSGGRKIVREKGMGPCTRRRARTASVAAPTMDMPGAVPAAPSLAAHVRRPGRVGRLATHSTDDAAVQLDFGGLHTESWVHRSRRVRVSFLDRPTRPLASAVGPVSCCDREAPLQVRFSATPEPPTASFSHLPSSAMARASRARKIDDTARCPQLDQRRLALCGHSVAYFSGWTRFSRLLGP